MCRYVALSVALLTYSFSQIILIKNEHTKTLFMTIEELMINFSTNNWSNITILILKISMEYVPNIREYQNKCKKSHEIQTKIKIKLS